MIDRQNEKNKRNNITDYILRYYANVNYTADACVYIIIDYRPHMANE